MRTCTGRLQSFIIYKRLCKPFLYILKSAVDHGCTVYREILSRLGTSMHIMHVLHPTMGLGEVRHSPPPPSIIYCATWCFQPSTICPPNRSIAIENSRGDILLLSNVELSRLQRHSSVRFLRSISMSCAR